MRKSLLLLALLCIVGFVGASNVYAIPVRFETGDYFAWGRLYDASGVPQNLNPFNVSVNNPTQTLTPGTYLTADGTEDAFGITQINSIEVDDGSGTILWQKSAGEELTAFFYGADDVLLTSTGQLYSNGFVVNLYLDNSPDFPGTPILGTSGRTGLSTFTNVTDGTLVLSLLGHTQYLDYPGITQPFALEETGTPSTGAFHGSLYLDVIGGAWASLYDTNTKDPLLSSSNADFLFTFTTVPNDSGIGGAYPWVIKDVSAAYGDVVPEPASMALLSLGLLGLARFRRKG